MDIVITLFHEILYDEIIALSYYGLMIILNYHPVLATAAAAAATHMCILSVQQLCGIGKAVLIKAAVAATVGSPQVF